ncbi:sensor histidine kinase [Butyrivibrio sp. LB2008]|uniref:sensor histidine kinase n=1 Tax=Butyrivibrio sp. LB2008 TaxID=1408305 RepID=UPI001FA7318B|nr:sensor histidine kinase [Butyrivibrio sp. LB2008]
MIKKIWENNRIYFVANLIYMLAVWGIGVLYNIETEFIFYEISFALIITVIAAIVNRKPNVDTTGIGGERDIEQEKDKMRWEKVREKEDFFALWAHQIKTPIAALKLLFEDEAPNTYECKSELFKIENYVEMALNYLRFEEMSGDLVLEKCSLEPLVKQTVKKFSTVFIFRHLSVELNNLDCDILTDDKWFSFVLEQVLSNALKYTKEGGIKIFSRDTDEGKEIVVSDSGVGIKSDDLPRVFEKGYTGYNGRVDKKASGIGLYLCKGVCNKLGHRIRIESELGKGCDVIITVRKETVNARDSKYI